MILKFTKKIDVYGAYIYVRIGTVEDINMQLKVDDKKIEYEFEGEHDGLTIKSNNGNSFIYLIEKHYTVGLLAHELMHVVSNMMAVYNIKHDPDNDEPIAYLMGYMMDMINDKYNKYLKNKSTL